MLNIQAIKNTAQAKAYFADANRDYFAAGAEHPAYWHGKAAGRLGLSGEVRMADFFALCDNEHPATGDRLTQRLIANRRVGYDFTFSAPKSVSVAWTLGGDERIASAFREAVAETMAEVERGVEARVRKRFANENRNVGNMVWCDWLHPEGRPIGGQPDPQLHVHAVVQNVVWDQEEKQWKAGDFAAVKTDAPYYHAVFLSRLANKLNGLGYEVHRTKDAFEIAGVPERALTEFSRRTKQIEDLAEKLGVVRPEGKAKLGATSREKKSKGLTWDDLLNLWSARLRPGEHEAITGSLGDGPVEPEPQHREAVDYALAHLTERKSVVRDRDVVREALKFGLGRGVTPEGVWAELGRPGVIRRDHEVTTKAVLAEEKRMLAFAVRGRGAYKPLGRPGLKPDVDYLSASQAAAVRHVWTSPDRLILVRGMAGSGKTTLTRSLLDGVNVPWVILAPSSQASRGVLRQEGFEHADTLARFLNDAEFREQARGGLIVLDEASLAGAKDVAQLTQSADQLTARVLLLGDRAQHKSVARGDVLALLEDKAGLPVATVGEIKRQRGEYKRAVELLAKGDAERAFDRLDRMGWVKDHFPDPTKMVADDYLAAVAEGKSVLVVAPTHAEGERITTELRERLKQEGKVGHDEREFTRLVPLNLTEAEKADPASYHPGVVVQFVRPGGGFKAGERVRPDRDAVPALARNGSRLVAFREDHVRLAPGDSVRLTANGRDNTGGHRLNNGASYTVAGFTDAGNVRLSNGWVLSKDFGHWTHGYVETSFGAQGKTVDRVLVAMPESTFPAVDMKTAYVTVSRGRERATVYTDRKDELKRLWGREQTHQHASDMVRQPIGSVRRQLKRHLAFLKQRAIVAFDKVLRPERSQEPELVR